MILEKSNGMSNTWTAEEYKEFLASGKKPEAEKKAKYGNKKTEVDEMAFDSEKEARRWGELKMMFKAKLISKPIRQYSFTLSDNIEYVADFVYFDYSTKEFVVEDVKGFRTEIYKIKKKLMLSNNGIEIKET